MTKRNKVSANELSIINSSKKSWQSIKNAFYENGILKITACSAIASAVVYGISYAYQCLLYLSWNIPIDYINASSSKGVYFVIFGTIYGTIISILVFYTYSKLLPIAMLHYLKKYTKRLIQPFFKKIKNENSEYKKTRLRLKERYKCLRKKTLLIKAKRLIPTIITMALLSLPSWVLFQATTLNPSKYAWLISIITSMLYVKTIYHYAKKKAKQKTLQIKQHIKDPDPINVLDTLDVIGTKFDELTKDFQETSNFIKVFSPLHAGFALGCGVIYIMVESLILGLSSRLSANSFWIHTMNNQDYAIIYINDDKAIFKKVDISEDEETITIFLDEHIYSTSTDKEYKHRTFKKIRWKQ